MLDQIRSLGELRVVTRNSPTTFYYGANERYGIEYELAKAFADQLGVRLKLTTVEDVWHALPQLTARQSHIAAAGIAVTAPRSEIVDFGPAYQNVRTLVIYRMGSQRPASLAETVGTSLEVRAGSSHADLLLAAQQQLPGLAWTELPGASAETLMRHVAAGATEFAIVNSNEFNLLRHYYPDVRTAFQLSAGNPLAWALPKGADDLREKVDEFFARIQATGELQQLLDRYYADTREFDFVDSRAFVRHLHQRFPQYQDSFFQAQAETGIDWRLIAAIAYQESHWDSSAVSPTGVKGLMMLTARTANMMGVADRSDPRASILGGARYLARVLKKFPERIPEEDRLMMAVAAYNIGFGHIEDARIITESLDADKDSWTDVRAHLPLLADERWYPHLKRGFAQGSVSMLYVDNVRHYYRLIKQVTGTQLFAALPTEDESATDDGSI
jgi:membrane-bound lytic murein transglycosylase F